MTEDAKRTVETLRYCEESGAQCGDCPNGFNDKGIPNCHSQSAIADLIESMTAELEQTENKLSELLYYVTGVRFSKTDYSTDDMRRFVEDYNKSVCSECEELEQVKRERDAAVEQMSEYCEFCVRYGWKVDELCYNCKMHVLPFDDDEGERENYWQWRGVKEETK